MEGAIVAEVSIFMVMVGFAFGFLVKGLIDTKFEKEVQKSLIRVGQMADDEIEDKDEEIKRLKEVIEGLQFERAVERFEKLKEVDA